MMRPSPRGWMAENPGPSLSTSPATPPSRTSKLVPLPIRVTGTPRALACSRAKRSSSRLFGANSKSAGPPIRKEVCFAKGIDSSAPMGASIAARARVSLRIVDSVLILVIAISASASTPLSQPPAGFHSVFAANYAKGVPGRMASPFLPRCVGISIIILLYLRPVHKFFHPFPQFLPRLGVPRQGPLGQASQRILVSLIQKRVGYLCRLQRCFQLLRGPG